MPYVIFWGQIHPTLYGNPISTCWSTEYILLTTLWICNLCDL